MKDILKTLKSSLKPLVTEVLVRGLLLSRIKKDRVIDGPLAVMNEYYLTSDKGLYRVHPGGIDKILGHHMYGFALQGDYFYAALHLSARSLLVRGRRAALTAPSKSPELKILYEIETPSTKERIHQLSAGVGALWAANTGRNSILKIDTMTGAPVQEIFPFSDSFGQPFTYDHNHINSIDVHDGFILFAAYRAGNGALVGIIEGDQVTGYAYKNVGIHDIYLTPGGFILCDTFGRNLAGEGGLVITQKGVFAPEIFGSRPGYVVRGAAQTGTELLIGHSHKGERAQRFKGQGSLLLWKDSVYAGEIKAPAAQVYQLVRADGRSFDQSRTSAADVKAMFKSAFDAPVYNAKAVIREPWK